jgi:hypothetical protein
MSNPINLWINIIIAKKKDHKQCCQNVEDYIKGGRSQDFVAGSKPEATIIPIPLKPQSKKAKTQKKAPAKSTKSNEKSKKK